MSRYVYFELLNIKDQNIENRGYKSYQFILISNSGVQCGSYGKAQSCDDCTKIYPMDSCLVDCNWMLNRFESKYECTTRGKSNNS